MRNKYKILFFSSLNDQRLGLNRFGVKLRIKSLELDIHMVFHLLGIGVFNKLLRAIGG